MGIFKLLSMSPNMMNSASSIFSGASSSSVLSSLFSDVRTAAVTNSWIGKIIGGVLSFLVDLLYFVAKWILYFVDVIFSYIQELAGLNIDLSSIEAATSPESDMIFNLLYNGRHLTTTIVRSLIGLSVAVIIIFSIIAIIKAQYDSVKTGQPTDLGRVTRNTLKAFVFLIITPLIAILGIIASDVLLLSLYNATNTSNSTSLGSKIFATSAVSANVYRLYAQEGLRVPIYCDFSEQEEILKYYENEPVTDKFSEYLKSTGNAIYTTYLTFNTAEFITYDSINTVVDPTTERINNRNAYYTIYDRANVDTNPLDATFNTAFNQYRKIENYTEEYFVMADVVDYAMESGAELYFKTIQEVLDSICGLKFPETPDAIALKNELLNDVVSMYNIKFIENDLTEKVIDSTNYDQLIHYYNSDSWKAIRFLSNYYSVDENHSPVSKMQIEYTHIRDASDELEGAKFIMACGRDYEFDGISYNYFIPLTIGYSVQSGYEFSSDYIQRGQIISAKGVFYDAMYPTAIKKNNEGVVSFYRDNIHEVAIGQNGALFNLDWVDDVSNGNFFSKIVLFFKALFNPASLLPQLNLDPNAVQQTYEKETLVVNVLDGGKMRIGYLMSSEFMSGLNDVMTGSIYGLNIENLFKVTSLNFLILVMGSSMLIRICFKSIFALIGRAYDLYLIILIYPTAVASMPLDEGGYNNWFKNYLAKLLSTYGLILGINFVFMLFPVIESIEFFTQDAVGSNIIIKRVGMLFFALMPVSQVTRLLNIAVVIMFELAAFTLLETLPRTVSAMLEARDLEQDNPINETLENISKAMKFVGTIAGGSLNVAKAVLTKDGREGLVDKFKSSLPMSDVVREAKNKKYLHDKKKEQKEAYKDLQQSLKTAQTEDGSSDPKKKAEEVKKKLTALNKAQNAYKNAIQNPTGARKADAAKQKKERAQAITSSKADSPEELAEQMAGKSNAELKEDVSSTDTMIESLREEKKGASRERKKEIDQRIKELKERRKAAKAEQKSRKGLGLFKNSRAKRARKTVEKLEELQRQGVQLTRRQQKQLESCKKYADTVDKVNSTEARHKADRRRAAEGANAAKRRKKEDYIARNGNFFQRRMQENGYKRRIKKLDRQIQEAGIDVSKLGDETYRNSLTDSQLALIRERDSVVGRQQQLQETRSSEMTLRGQRRQQSIGQMDYYAIEEQHEQMEEDRLKAEWEALQQAAGDDPSKKATAASAQRAYENYKKAHERRKQARQEEQDNAVLQKMFRDKAMRKRAVAFLTEMESKNPKRYTVDEESIREYIRNVYRAKHG